MRIRLTPHQLAAFLDLARAGSFSLAARERGVSQSALTRIIQHMEAMIGRTLFDRTTRSVELTPTGRELLPIAERIVAEFDDDLSELARFVEGRRGTVVVAALPSIAAVLLPPAIARLQAQAPEVEVSILDGLSGSVIEAVEKGRADFGLTIQPSDQTALTWQPLVADPFGLVCRHDDPLAGKGPLPWSVLVERPFIAMAPESSVRQMTDAALRRAALSIPQLYGCAFLGTTGHLVASGLGVTALPRLTLPLLGSGDLAWRPLENPIVERRIGLVTPIGRTLSPAAKALAEQLQVQSREPLSRLSPPSS
jgi:DNA-binding transcriptional LysR family regulator